MAQEHQKKWLLALDSAESLFATHGFYSVTIRDIARGANLSPEAINSLFKDKEQIFRKVVERRATVINLMRVESLTRIDPRDHSLKTFKSILGAFFEPLYAKSTESEGWMNYLRLVPQIMRQRSPILSLVVEYYTPISDLYMKRIGHIFPDVPEDVLAKYWHFALLIHFSVFLDEFHVGDFQLGISGSKPRAGSRYENFRHAQIFVMAGFESLHRSRKQ